MQEVCLPSPKEAAVALTRDRLVRVVHLTTHPGDLEQSKLILVSAGIKAIIRPVDTGEKFAELLLARTVDLIISDSDVAGLTGLDAMKMTSSISPQVPFIFFASKPAEDDIIEAIKFGALDYISKDNPDRLAKTIHSALQSSDGPSHKARAWLAAIVDSSNDAIISKNLDGIITSWNLGAQRLLGYHAEEVLGKPITIILPADKLEEESQILEKLRRGERIENFETVRLTKDGRLVHVSLTISPVKDVNGVVVGASKIARDISETKSSERLLQHAHEILSHYAEDLQHQVAERTTRLEGTIQSLAGVCYHIAHDLRAPVRSIRSFIEMLVQAHEPGFDDKEKDYVRRMIQSCYRMDLLIDDLLAYGRLSHTELPMKPVDVGEVLDTILEQNAQEIVIKAASMQVIGPFPLIWGNTGVLEQILGNLISNALKYVSPGVAPKIRISATELEAHVLLSVEDNGIGIPKIHQERVFHMFERLHLDRDYPGTGIGLAIVQKGVERLGGRVLLESEPGHGSRFTLELPKAITNTKPAVTEIVSSRDLHPPVASVA